MNFLNKINNKNLNENEILLLCNEIYNSYKSSEILNTSLYYIISNDLNYYNFFVYIIFIYRLIIYHQIQKSFHYHQIGLLLLFYILYHMIIIN